MENDFAIGSKRTVDANVGIRDIGGAGPGRDATVLVINALNE